MLHEIDLIRSLGLDHLIGTPALKPYMHGYFVSLGLYDTARVIANPFAYAEHREKLVKERLEKLADTRIRTRKDGATTSIKVNKALAERIERNAERERKREEKKKARKAEKAMEGDEAMPVDEQEEAEKEQVTLLNDPRFRDLFENPDFAVDETTREYALLNPSSVASRNANSSRGKTAVEDEEEESDKMSSDGLGSSGDESSEDDSESDDSSDTGGGYRGKHSFPETDALRQQRSISMIHGPIQGRKTHVFSKSTHGHATPIDGRAKFTLCPLSRSRVDARARRTTRMRRLDNALFLGRLTSLLRTHLWLCDSVQMVWR